MTAIQEDIKTIDIEEWLTLATAPSPTRLKQGQSPNMNNVWVDEKPGSVITAPGFVKVGTNPGNNASKMCLSFFKASTGTQQFIDMEGGGVYSTLDFITWTPITTFASSTYPIRGMVIRDKLWLTNGIDAVRVYDGTTTILLDGTGGTPDVPKGRYIGFHDERVWLYHLLTDRSSARFSALVDNTGAIIEPDNAAAWPIDNEIQISEGDADFGTGLILYRGYLYAFKQYSIYRIIGYDEYTYSRVKTRASTGTRFSESLQIKDNLVHLIGVDGIYVFDGEDAERISDIIAPSSGSQSAFGFNDIQQPNSNNQFFRITDTADWNTGTVPTNLHVDDSLALVAADDSQADFAAGATLTNVSTTDNPGFIQLNLSSSGVSSVNIALNALATLVPGSGGAVIGSANFVTDGNLVNVAGVTISNPAGSYIGITIPSGITIKTVVFKGLIAAPDVQLRVDGVTISVLSISDSTNFVITAGDRIRQITNVSVRHDLTVTYAVFSGTDMRFVTTSAGTTFQFSVTEIQVFTTAYNPAGQFISKTLDLSVAPASYGNFNVDVTLNGQTSPTFYTQSSADGVSWDAAVACTNGGAIGSTLRRYLRWRADFTSDGNNTPSIDAVYLMSQYISPVHNTGGSIFEWGPFESDRDQAGQIVNFYYRDATTSGGVLAAAWNSIVPGGVISSAVANQYIQFKIEILSGALTTLPIITSVTINWVEGTGIQPSALQNVASAIWGNRYWLSVAGEGATANDTIIISGKKTANSPWQLKDWPISSFTRFHDSFYGTSSVDGSIYKLDTGYSKAGEAMDSFLETGDFIFGGFFAALQEVLIETERLGPYSLYVGVSIDQGATWTELPVDLTVSTFSPTFIKRLNLSANSDRMRFRVRTNGADQPFQVHRFIASYTLGMSRGSIR